MCCAGEGQPAGEAAVLRAAGEAAEQTTPGHRAAGGDQVHICTVCVCVCVCVRVCVCVCVSEVQ